MAVAVINSDGGPVLDHVAIGTRELNDGWALFGRVLGGQWAYGSDSPGYWWGQLAFARGPKIELLRPTGGPGGAFLERFLASRGAGAHHYNFLVPDIRAALQRVAELGIQPVQVNLDNPVWKEAFLHPRSAHGVVIQIAQQARTPESDGPPAGLDSSACTSTFGLVEHHVTDVDAAVRLFTTVLGACADTSEKSGAATDRVELTWPNDARIRLVRSPPGETRPGVPGFIHHLEFSRDDGEQFSPDDMDMVQALAGRLGIALKLRSASRAR